MISIGGKPIVKYLTCFDEAKAILGAQVFADAMNNFLKAQGGEQKKAAIALETKFNQLRPHWIATFRRHYIQKLTTNIKIELAKSGGKDLFTKKQAMINSFELQVLDGAGKPLDPIYKLAPKDPTNN